MQIGIDARMFGPQQGGLGRYIEQLILQLEKIDLNNDYTIFLRKENWDCYNPTNLRFKKVLANIKWYGFGEQILFPIIIKKEKIDLMHFPHWNVPIFYNDKFVVTIHDLLLLHFPTRHASTLGPLLYWFKNKMFKLTLNHAVKVATKIIAVSEYSKQDIAKTLKINTEKIVVTYLSPLEKNILEAPFSLYNRYNITKPYWLYVGVAYPHKNLFKLVDAWEIYCKQNGYTYQLVLTGKNNYFYALLKTYIKNKNIKDVVFTDFVPDTELPELYRNASLYVFPSLYEGFGLPPLEAIQNGLPVIASDRTCLPEILEDAAVYFNPDDPNAIVHAANLVIKDSAVRKNLIINGSKILQKYSWQKTALKTIEIYSQAK
ncbi:MAG: glycosyl transferase, group 1 [uncultured bacterium]|uniref:Glycosyl transferase family 1 n=1 Tax=Candidatus Magasanikbacteria bacterium RIFOXYD2_FULL_36_9 TaxID=1798707 RepID=A0A1F6NZ48_9BACT|nr:MAG: glycosyl transferase, group 1 [uncultured bacterium]OGH89003.1 MAG: hypothetical protein A2537_01155 [Candidatus Magasanikbacteria bacterium RIFOXYD2_FULL_36_9]